MTDTDFPQPGHGPLRAAARAAELAQAAPGLVSTGGCRVADSDPLVPLARRTARPVTGAGLTMHQCAQRYPQCRPGGVCLLAVPPGPAYGRAAITVSWTPHSLLALDRDRYGTCTGTQQAMTTALGGVLRAFGHPVTPFGSGGARLVTGRRGDDPGAGR